jgi:DNA-binding LacI/PurR family transcriptional regulator
MPTIIDIAKRTGVSVGTISNYLNNPKVVSETTQIKIKMAIEELGYQPRAAARTLKSKLTRQIGFIPQISPEENRDIRSSDNVLLDFLGAINTILTENNYSLLMHGAITQAEEIQIYQKLIGEKQVDGVILMGTRVNDPRIRYLLEKNFPFVSFGRTNTTKDYSFVDVDGEKGIALAVEHLIQLGHTRIGYIAPPGDLMCAEHRWRGYCAAMSEHHLRIDEEIIIEGGFTENAGMAAMNVLLDRPNPPTAVITCNDLCAFGAMHTLQSRGLEAGDDCSIVGFDNIRLSAHWQPALTTIDQPIRQVGFQVAGKMLSLIAKKEFIHQSIIAPELIVRQSTGRPRKDLGSSVSLSDISAQERSHGSP